MTKEQFALRGVAFVLFLLLFIISAMMTTYMVNRDKDRSAYFWMAVFLISGLICAHLSKYLA
jgi:hypothetical protein